MSTSHQVHLPRSTFGEVHLTFSSSQTVLKPYKAYMLKHFPAEGFDNGVNSSKAQRRVFGQHSAACHMPRYKGFTAGSNHAGLKWVDTS